MRISIAWLGISINLLRNKDIYKKIKIMTNFGHIKDKFTQIVTESVVKSKDSKKVIKSFVNAIKESEILKTQFLVYSNLEEKTINSEYSAGEYIKENLALLTKFDAKTIVAENEKLAALLPKTKEVASPELYEHINFLVTTKKTAKNIDKFHESFEFIKKHIMTEKAVEQQLTESAITNLPPSVIANLAVSKFNNKYADLTESEKKAIKAIMSNDVELQKSAHSTIVIECLDAVNAKLDVTEDLDVKDKLLRVKDKVLRMQYVSESFVKDFGKLVDLKKDLLK